MVLQPAAASGGDVASLVYGLRSPCRCGNHGAKLADHRSGPGPWRAQLANEAPQLGGARGTQDARRPGCALAQLSAGAAQPRPQEYRGRSRLHRGCHRASMGGACEQASGYFARAGARTARAATALLGCPADVLGSRAPVASARQHAFACAREELRGERGASDAWRSGRGLAKPTRGGSQSRKNQHCRAAAHDL
jgi:hypothetical protein